MPPAPLDAPEPLAALVAAMLNPVPVERPSAEQAGRSLRGWLDGRVEAEAVTAAVAVAASPATLPPPRSRLPRLAGIALAAVMVLLVGAVTLLGFGAVPAAVSPTDRPTTAPVAVESTPAPTPARTAAPDPVAATANQPTATRSAPNLDPPPKAPKAEHNKKPGHKKPGHKKPGHKKKH
jgi:hypothetical protein